MIKLFGSKDCRKTKFYEDYLNEKGVQFVFVDVLVDTKGAAELRELYVTKKLNFPTLLVGAKKLRNPRLKDVDKWLLSELS